MSSTLWKLVEPFVFLVIIGIMGFTGYVVYSIMTKLSRTVNRKMTNKGVQVTRKGAQVRVKGVSREDYMDKTQSVLVNVWRNSEMEGYKSRLWNTEKPKK
ncbi:hypothetical protein NEOLI_000982 [Neolecta irregularis DAH-3]|uniref:Uncharacterized protein n=1 Tax=Neolecta irregularis (strain DAH-3) TaxID=1198029 RepID=A0A1U7LGU5_NEOID|nr:hypothetical protein NEOLI_000982 [Neolecta irregularis DAH-3]|eukprot:OLL21880.1 hypothetical protein NEOLI_000982 [Neolecta irregularis DAH-3]